MKMSEKKRWFSENCKELQEKQKLDISWSSSDSESENTDETFLQKKPKLDKNSFCQRRTNSWICIAADGVVTPCKLNSDTESLKVGSLSTSPCLKDDFLGSPVIENIKLEKSPILSNDTNSTTSNEKSPVISRRHILKKIKWRCKLRNESKTTQFIQEESSSSSVFLSQRSINQPITISPAKSEISPSWKIDSFLSQHSSEIVTSSSTSSEFKTLYHEPPPRRKKFKKGGLANQLKKALDSQSTSLAIWQHEMFLIKEKTDGNEEFMFKVRGKWKEYGCTILECELMSEESKHVPTCFADSKNEAFLVVLAINLAINTNFELNNCYTIFPPYSIHSLEHKLKETFCLVNACRFLRKELS